MSRGLRIFLALVAAEAVAVATLAVALAVAGSGEAAEREVRRALAAELRLTGLALGSEASYCRHPAEADLFAPHAEHPAAPEHFPAGSFVPPRPPGVGGGR